MDQRKQQISWKKKSGLVDSGFVKTCDELDIGADFPHNGQKTC